MGSSTSKLIKTTTSQHLFKPTRTTQASSSNNTAAKGVIFPNEIFNLIIEHLLLNFEDRLAIKAYVNLSSTCHYFYNLYYLDAMFLNILPLYLMSSLFILLDSKEEGELGFRSMFISRMNGIRLNSGKSAVSNLTSIEEIRIQIQSLRAKIQNESQFNLLLVGSYNSNYSKGVENGKSLNSTACIKELSWSELGKKRLRLVTSKNRELYEKRLLIN